VIQEAMGPLEFRLDGGYVRADGQRNNSEYDLWQTDLYIGWRPDEHQLLALDFYSSRFDGGDPGRITYKQFINDPNFSFTPFNDRREILQSRVCQWNQPAPRLSGYAGVSPTF
jgi:Fe(3+) dicitrate transport protein